MAIRQQNFCAFCGGNNLSKEHLWPEWMHHLLPTDTSQSHVSLLQKRDYVDGELVHERHPRKHQGPMKAAKFRIVCRTCNSEWMSGIENRAKPILSSLMLAEETRLDKSAVEKIAAWLALRTIIFEFSGTPDSKTVPKSDYDFIRAHRLPPAHWRIWIGYQDSPKWIMRIYNLPTMQMFQSQLASYIESGKPRKTNVLTTSFGLGQLFAYVCFTNEPKLIDNHNSAVDNFRTDRGDPILLKVWPYTEDLIWPHAVLLDTGNVDYIANAINSISKPVPAEFRDAISTHEESCP